MLRSEANWAASRSGSGVVFAAEHSRRCQPARPTV